jgi:hypothetical protein
MDMVVSPPPFYHGKEPRKKRNKEEKAGICKAFEGQTKYQV